MPARSRKQFLATASRYEETEKSAERRIGRVRR
jgi:hypothetical protein